MTAMTKLFMGVMFLIIISGFACAYSNESSCCCRSWGGGVECASSENSFCGSTGLPNGVYSYLIGLGSNVCNPTWKGDNFYFTKGCGEYGEGCWNSIYCIGFKTGSCEGKCFDRETQKCCKDMSGLICRINQHCADSDNDGKSDICLDELPPVPKCPSVEELGSCKVCNSNTGEVSNIPLGISSGECSGMDLNNDCNELACDGFGSCISSYSGNLCTPYLSVSLNAKVNDLIVDDFSKLKDMVDEINYSQIFPPNLICNASVGNYKLNGDFVLSKEIVNLKFDFIIESAEPRKSLYSQNLNCEGSCSLSLPEQAANEIKPDDLISCEVTGNSETKSSRINMPGFDLYISRIKAFNVIEDVPLVAGKPLGASIQIFFKSGLITNMDKDVQVRYNQYFNNALVYAKTSSFKPVKEFNLDEVKNRIKENPDFPDNKDREITEKVKKAEDTFNFFNLPVPANEGNLKIRAEIDFRNEFPESYDDSDMQNLKEESFSVTKTRKIKILPVEVLIGDVSGYRYYFSPFSREVYSKIPIIRKYYPVSNLYSQKVSYEFVRKNTEYLKKIYPFAPSDVELMNPVTITVLWKMSKPLDSKDYKWDKALTVEILKLLDEKAKKSGADYAAGVAYYTLMRTDDGSADGLSNIIYPGAVILTGPEPGSKVSDIASGYSEAAGLVHELAHLNGISAGTPAVLFPDYSSGELGRAASNGWLINQYSGNGEEPRINVWNKAGEIVYNVFDIFSIGENSYSRTMVGFTWLDLLGEKGKGIHVYKEQYMMLLNNYKMKK